MNIKKLICAVFISGSMMACQPLLREQVKLNQAQLSSLEYKISILEKKLEQGQKENKQALLDHEKAINQIREEQSRLAALLPPNGQDDRTNQLQAVTRQDDHPVTHPHQARQPRADTKLSSPGHPQGDPAAQLYHKALSDLREKKDIKLAKEEFQTLIRNYPKTHLLPNAFYWLGECEYAQKQFVQAIIAFKEVSNRYPLHPKAADSLLKMGFAYLKLGDRENAKFYLRKIIDQYPKSHAAVLARQKLSQI